MSEGLLFRDGERIIFAGDSVTDMKSTAPLAEGLGDSLGFGYVRMVENLLTAFYPERNIRVTNCGVSGNTSRSLLERYECGGSLTCRQSPPKPSRPNSMNRT